MFHIYTFITMSDSLELVRELLRNLLVEGISLCERKPLNALNPDTPTPNGSHVRFPWGTGNLPCSWTCGRVAVAVLDVCRAVLAVWKGQSVAVWTCRHHS
ncbi:hypothetical protein BDZ89DRAFT_1084216 [Hymenopellis radicata]|nr:hypothetical protein BDZ89DRAFT_1084216 [Hymenopellis radicata]